MLGFIQTLGNGMWSLWDFISPKSAYRSLNVHALLRNEKDPPFVWYPEGFIFSKHQPGACIQHAGAEMS